MEALEPPEDQYAKSTEELFQLVYEELRGLARKLSFEAGHTLQPTALVHDAFLKLGCADRRWDGKRHFFAVAAKAMRQLLRDHARAKRAVKRGKGRRDVTLHDVAAPDSDTRVDALLLDEAFESLARIQPDAASVAELRILAGLATEDIAAILGVSPRKVQLDWRAARAWLATRLDQESDS